METVYKREKKYNDEAGGRLSGDMDDTKENGDKVINMETQKYLSLLIVWMYGCQRLTTWVVMKDTA